MGGGGVVFGPQPRDWSIKMNQKERRLAMGTALQSAASRKTRDCVEKLGSMGVGTAGGKLSEKCLVVTKDDANVDLYLAGRNLPGLEFNTADRLNLVEVLRADRILVEESALTAINERYG